MDRERVKNVVKQMTLEEKTALTNVGADLTLSGLPRLKVPAMLLPRELLGFSEAALLHRFPSFFAFGHTFDRELVRAFGRLRSREAMLKGESFGGVVSLSVTREPFGLDAVRSFSEEPLLCAELAAAYTEGSAMPVMGCGLPCTGGSYRYIGERALNEIYLYPFYRNARNLGGVCLEGGTLSGVPVGENRAFIKKIASAFDGLIVNGAGCSFDKAEEVSSGACLDVMSCKGDGVRLYNAVKNGTLFERKLDICVERNVYAAAVCYNAAKKAALPAVSQNEADSLYLRLAEESAVLLKNKGVLPLNASDRAVCFGSLVLEGALNVYVDFEKGGEKRVMKAADKAKGADKAVIFVENAADCDGTLIKKFVMEVKRFCPVTVVAYAERYFPLPFLDGCDALVFLPYFGKFSVRALHSLLTGECDFTGKLACSWAASRQDYPARREEKFASRDCYCGESVYVGGRFFSSFKADLLFPFGYGMSYSGCEFGLLKGSVKDGELNLSFDAVGRQGASGEAVVTVSGGFASDSVYGVTDRLAAFSRVHYSDCVKKERLSLPFDALDVYDSALGKFVPCGGRYDFRIGSSFDVRASCGVKAGGKVKLTGEGQKELPSYYKTGGDFKISAREAERVVGRPPSASDAVIAESQLLSARKTVRRAYLTKAVKKSGAALRRFDGELAAIAPPALIKLQRYIKENGIK